MGKKQILAMKKLGFSDSKLAELLALSESEFTQIRHGHNIRPVYKRVDSCAAEFDASTDYFYSTYENKKNPSEYSDGFKIIMI